MLEDIAHQYINTPEDKLRLIAYGFTIVGFIVAVIITRSKSELRRAPYFAYSGLLFLAAAVTQFVWLGSSQAMAGGFLWVLMAVDVVSTLIIGYFFGIIARARSHNAFGHGRHSILAWRLSNTMETQFCVDALDGALGRHSPPEIFNTDQGSQFTSWTRIQRLQAAGVRGSMDGRSRFLDNIFIERGAR